MITNVLEYLDASAARFPAKTAFNETAVAPDGSTVNKEMETNTLTTQNADGSVTVTDTLKETVSTDGMDGSKREVNTESTRQETTDSKKNADGSVTDTTVVSSTEVVKESTTDADGKVSVTESKAETESSVSVTTTENADGSVTEKTEKNETVKTTEKTTDEQGRVTEKVTETTTETVINITRDADGTETGTSISTATVKDENGNVLSVTVTESEIKASTDESGLKTTETASTATTTDAEGNETVVRTVTTENKTPDGSTGTDVKDEDGKVLLRETVISREEADKAQEEGRPIQAPITMEPVSRDTAMHQSTDIEGVPVPLTVTLPSTSYDKDGDGLVSQAEKPRVEISIPYSGQGIIAMFRGLLGQLITSRDCYPGSIIIPMYGSGEVYIVDNTKSFADVSESDWYYDYVTFVTAREIINGIEEDRFAPEAAMSRAMAAQMLFDYDCCAEAGDGAVFGDVSEDDPFCGAVGWACENGYMEASEGAFRPEADMTCQELIAMLYRWASSAGYDMSASAELEGFPDAGDVAEDAVEAMRWAVGLGLIGTEDGALNPTAALSRAETAAVMTRFVCSAR